METSPEAGSFSLSMGTVAPPLCLACSKAEGRDLQKLRCQAPCGHDPMWHGCPLKSKVRVWVPARALEMDA